MSVVCCLTCHKILSLSAVVTIGFVEPFVVIPENGGGAGLKVAVLSGMLDSEVRLQFTTRDGSSVAPSDYTSNTQTLVFNSAISSLDVTVLIIEDDVDELNKSFFADLSLLTDTDRVTIAQAVSTIIILDDDGAYTVRLYTFMNCNSQVKTKCHALYKVSLEIS